MAEYIEREAAKQKLAPAINDPEAVDFWEWQCSEIDGIPAADVRPVVLCKDCVYLTRDKHGAWCFNNYEANLKDDDFCSHGKRKERVT